MNKADWYIPPKTDKACCDVKCFGFRLSIILNASAASAKGVDDISRSISRAGSPGANALPAIENVDKARSAPMSKAASFLSRAYQLPYCDKMIKTVIGEYSL
jgi:hypothetical protein